MSPALKQQKPWIRGVNLGGWLVLERFITPYFFAITNCTLKGDFTFHPNQIDAPPPTHPLYRLVDDSCEPVSPYPVEEWTLLQAFADASSSDSKEVARDYMKVHWDNFLTRENISTLKNDAHVTHVRVPLGHWIMGDIRDDEPWVDGGWEYFERLVGWCREEGIEVWPDLHTAPGSQNGFDNSGLLLESPTCLGWDSENQTSSETDVVLSENVLRTLKAVGDITAAIAHGNMTDVVTGFGILNEPFVDCDKRVVKKFDDMAFAIAKENLGENTAIYIPDMFNSSMWNDGWWTNEDEYQNTFLDSHYYHVFAERPRGLSPRQHIAYVCEHNQRDTVACCYEDENKIVPSPGISRIIGEWSASFDTLVCDKLDVVMAGIAANGFAPEFDRKIEPKRQAFLRNFVEAQMVTYEAADIGVSRGWFYWNFKMEGGAFAEWDFLRGLKENWIPAIPPPDTSSVNLYGTCEDIIFRTDDDVSIIHEFPDPKSLDPNNWQGVDISDDVVLSHGEILLEGVSTLASPSPQEILGVHDDFGYAGFAFFVMIITSGFYVHSRKKKRERRGYIEVTNYGSKDDGQALSMTV